ncbi:MAG: Hint domain-containing protein [Acetobacteraceae bacterium]
MPSNTIISTNAGVTLTGAGYYSPVTVNAGAIVTGPTSGIDASLAWSILNLGSVTGTTASGIRLQQGGTVVNGTSGGTVSAAAIDGASSGIYVSGAAGDMANYGTISAASGIAVILGAGGSLVNGASGATAALITGFSGVFAATAAATVTNDGTISGTGSNGVVLTGGGSVTNGAAGPTTSTALIAGALYGVYIKGGAGTLTNYGTVTGAANYGVRIDGGGTLVNGIAGANVALISGQGGVQASGNTLAVVNYGSISADNAGVALNDGGSVDNAQADAVISAGNGGVDIFGGGTVRNLGTITGLALHGVYLFDGGIVTNGASAATIAAALISGGYYGIRIGFNGNGGTGTITNFGTVHGTGNHALPGYAAVVIDGPGGSVANSGIIQADAEDSFDRAIRLNSGGSVSNAALGSIIGDGAGVDIRGTAGSVGNAGSISALNANGGVGIYLTAGGAVDNTDTAASIRGAAIGVDIAGDAGTVGNLGTIIGLAPLDGGMTSSKGVQLRQGGTVVNGQSGSTAGQIYGYSAGVYVYGPTSGGTSLGAGTVTNFGTIIGRSLFGIDLRDGGTVTNGASGAASAYVYGASYGVAIDFVNAAAAPNVTGTVTNFGTISGGATGVGVAVQSGGVVRNEAGATIVGGYGVTGIGPGGVGLTVVNAGTIIGSGPGNFAVWLQTPNNQVVVAPGAVFDGQVVAGGNATLQLASAAAIGTISGIGGGAFVNFGTFTVDSGAHWLLAGSNSVDPGAPITIGDDADLQVTGTLTGAASVALGGGTIAFAGLVDAGDQFDFAGTAGALPSLLSLGDTDGTGFDNPITSLGALDTITVDDVTFAAGSTPVVNGSTVSVSLAGGGTFSFTNVAFEDGTPDPLVVTDHSIIDMACFAAGTAILTEHGEVPVEALRPGDQVVTLTGATRPVHWIGHRRLDLTRHPDPRRAQPIRIRHDAFADGMPCRDLLVSPDHALFLDGVLVPARLLLNGSTIVQATECRSVQYFHVELDSHDILFADGMAAESYLDTGNRGMFENADQPLILHPDLLAEDAQRRREARSCVSLVGDTARAEALWRQLAERAAALGEPIITPATTGDPAPYVLAGQARLAPISTGDGCYRFAVAGHAGRIRLVSRASAPCDVAPWVEDRRLLGIMLRRLVLHLGKRREAIALDDPMLADGWWPVEGGDGDAWRWSRGDATLMLPDDATLLEVHVGNGVTYLAA